MQSQSFRFPPGFFWGTATSAYQIEGGLTNDWSEWERSPQRLAYLKAKNFNPADFQSALAANSWNQLEADIQCVKKLNNNAYRFSIEWSRIEPTEGQFNKEALEKYHQFILRLKAEGIEPFVTLWHWPLPLWLRDQGGWTNANIITYYNRYVAIVVKALPEVRFWLTLNEPTIYAGKSYLEGTWPPQKKNFLLYVKVLQHLIKAHKVIYTTIKKIQPQAQVGIVMNNIDFDPAPGIINKALAGIINWWWNERILNQLKGYQDMIGLNFYFHNRVNYGFSKNLNEKVSDMGWELYPSSITAVLSRLKKYKLPIYITENGLADSEDKYRAWYIIEILRHIYKAIKAGVDVRGYFHWSLLDNFEWAEGFIPKFGLFTVDQESWQRTPRPSATVYANIAKNNEV